MSEDEQEATLPDISVGDLCRTDFGSLVLVIGVRVPGYESKGAAVMTMAGEPGHYVDLSMLDPVGERRSP